MDVIVEKTVCLLESTILDNFQKTIVVTPKTSIIGNTPASYILAMSTRFYVSYGEVLCQSYPALGCRTLESKYLSLDLSLL